MQVYAIGIPVNDFRRFEQNLNELTVLYNKIVSQRFRKCIEIKRAWSAKRAYFYDHVLASELEQALNVKLAIQHRCQLAKLTIKRQTNWWCVFRVRTRGWCISCVIL